MMQDRFLIDVADFYSQRADYPLRSIEPGEIIVAGSDKRYRETGRSMLWMAVFNDRAFVSTQSELAEKVRDVVGKVFTQEQFHDDDVRNRLEMVCRGRLTSKNKYYLYSGMKLYCDKDTHICIRDESVRKLTRDNAAEAITRLSSVGIPDEAGYLLTDNAACAYYAEGHPVAFAGTHPAGGMSDRIGDVMVGTLDGYRRHGYGKAVLSATTGTLIGQGRVAVLGTYDDNIAVVKTGQSVGFRVYCRVFEVRFQSE